MKTWTMPKVNIEAFTPNEYVATCKEFADAVSYMDSNGLYYFDIHNETDFVRTSAGGFYNAGYEEINGSDGNGGWYVNSGALTGWYTDSKAIYSYSPGTPSNNLSYSYFRKIRYNAKVYVLSTSSGKKAYFYDATKSYSFTPSEEKNYSS